MKKYINRIADSILEKKLKGKGAVLIQGPKWCGKTTTAEQISNSILYMAKPEDKEQNLTLADINLSLLLNGNTPRLIDEWQIAPKLWDAVIAYLCCRGGWPRSIFMDKDIALEQAFD